MPARYILAASSAEHSCEILVLKMTISASPGWHLHYGRPNNIHHVIAGHLVQGEGVSVPRVFSEYLHVYLGLFNDLRSMLQYDSGPIPRIRIAPVIVSTRPRSLRTNLGHQ